MRLRFGRACRDGTARRSLLISEHHGAHHNVEPTDGKADDSPRVPVQSGWRQYKSGAGAGDLLDMTIRRIDFAIDLLGPIERVCGAVARFAP